MLSVSKHSHELWRETEMVCGTASCFSWYLLPMQRHASLIAQPCQSGSFRIVSRTFCLSKVSFSNQSIDILSSSTRKISFAYSYLLNQREIKYISMWIRWQQVKCHPPVEVWCVGVSRNAFSRGHWDLSYVGTVRFLLCVTHFSWEISWGNGSDQVPWVCIYRPLDQDMFVYFLHIDLNIY